MPLALPLSEGLGRTCAVLRWTVVFMTFILIARSEQATIVLVLHVCGDYDRVARMCRACFKLQPPWPQRRRMPAVWSFGRCDNFETAADGCAYVHLMRLATS